MSKPAAKFKTHQDLVKMVFLSLGKIDDTKKKTVEESALLISTLKQQLFGAPDAEPPQEVIAQITQEIYNSNLLLAMIQSLVKVDFESKKDIVSIFGKVLRRKIGERLPTVEYICSNDGILLELIKGYSSVEVYGCTGQMLRDCCKHEPLAKIVLNLPEFASFFKCVQHSSFDVQAEAFSTFKDLLTTHKVVAATYLEVNYDFVFREYTALLNSENYVTRRQSLKLLGEVLLERANFSVMTKYIGITENLKLIMTMLRDNSRNIQYEAFHVFKVFVANPNKSKAILDILMKNKDKLVEFLSKFHNDRNDDAQFGEEKNYLVTQLKELKG